MKVLSVFGTRPEAVKMAPVVKELEKRAGHIISRVCVTAQHRQMLDQVLSLFEIQPDHDLNVMQDSQSPTQVAAAVLAKLEPVLQAERPDWVLVQGDTTTVASAALAAFYAGAKVGHVEAGLRTFDKYQPFPEEINRRVAGVIADLHFAPTQRARENLLREGVPDAMIRVTGNPVIDALHMVADLPYDPASGPLAPVPWNQRLILVTAHRRENFGQPLEQVCLALQDIAQIYAGDAHIVYPVHLNPNVQEPARRILSRVPGVTLTDPLDYLPLVYLMKRATLVLTDSGGIQEEAPGLGKPVLVLREVTERPEAVDAGTVRVVGTDRARIVEWARRLLDDPAEYDKMARAVNPYGDGQAAPRIVDAILGNLKSGER
jgi:UDP-N-acetylglucosamine 2-epimerase (non-hydrolysing)